ncbi:MAG: helix-turn-helix transcriptional regulator [Oscillospiraceae bacterium]|nr:helix-turn-helix transcriptional regulator [Oscillospiraceae bacterium]
MVIEELLARREMSRYRLALESGVPHATLNDICSGKTRIEKCSAETVYKLARTLGVSMELLTEDGLRQAERERAYEYGLPDYLQHDLDAYKAGVKSNSGLLDCLWGELYGSINMAEISDGCITPEHADYLRKKYLFGNAARSFLPHSDHEG